MGVAKMREIIEAFIYDRNNRPPPLSLSLYAENDIKRCNKYTNNIY